MENHKPAIKILIKDLKERGLEQAVAVLGSSIKNNSIVVEMLGEKFLINLNGVFKGREKASEIETIIILNAALSPGAPRVSDDFKAYDKFSGTIGHIDYFKYMVEVTLAKNAERIIEKKELILKKYNASKNRDNTGSDLSFTFIPFPNIRFFCQLYLADDEFQVDAKFYISANADKFMPAQCFEQLAMMWVKQVKAILDE